MEYIVVQGNNNTQLGTAVTKAIREGYELYGSITACEASNAPGLIYLYQAMIKNATKVGREKRTYNKQD